MKAVAKEARKKAEQSWNLLKKSVVIDVDEIFEAILGEKAEKFVQEEIRRIKRRRANRK